MLDGIAEMPYVALQSMLDAGAPHGLHYYMKSIDLAGLTEGAIDDIVAHAASATSPLTQVHLHHLGGAVARVPDDATAYAHRRAAFALNVVAAWTDPATTDRHVAWSRALHDAAAAHSSGGLYVNFLGDEGQDRVRAAYGEQTYARLRVIKREVDPENVFRFNQNVRST
ncbi:MAG TPA: BBE domain-containing protein [Polyangiaceae bacterium]